MRWVIGVIFVNMLLGCTSKSTKFLQSKDTSLSKPIISVDSILFVNETSISANILYQGSTIRYTTDGNLVTKKSPVFPGQMSVNASAIFKFKSFHSDFKPSETVRIDVRKISMNQQTHLSEKTTNPKKPYLAEGISSLLNNKKGFLTFRDNEEWLGYQNGVIEFHLTFDEPLTCRQISLSTLVDHASWIFSPSKIEAVENDEVVFKKEYTTPNKMEPPNL